ncbi:MAG: bifunctional proline dehydrogenase/L-glutamate gamma-semialdehyde dehydrogenase [Planctomycetes bacterium]|nr:bifunctional proline dehydrogenase/L-glutamate gamma-semialdehyde dehydrogenase [Planctomycetota bacterium]
MNLQDGLNAEIAELGRDLWSRTRGEVPGVFDKGYWQGKILEWAMHDPTFKVDMFRFVDVLPTLVGTEQVSQHVREYLLKPGRELPTLLGAALKIASGGLAAGLAARAIRKNVTDLAERFIVGRNAREALPVLCKLYDQQFAFTVDLLGEAVVSDAEADAYATRYVDLIENLYEEVSRWPANGRIDRNHLGPIPRTNVSLKISAMEPHIDPVDPAGSAQRLQRRVLPLFLRAKDRNVFLNVDLEQWSIHGITYDLFERLLLHPQLNGWPHVGIVVQAYLKSAEDDLRRMLELARRRGAPITIRLVKGAYWDYEVVHAGLNGYPCPVLTSKDATDSNYERLSALLLENFEHLLPAFGSHNLRSLTHAIVLARRMKVPPEAYEIQMLYGMAEPERAALRSMGHRVRLYAPVGEMLPGMAYLVRRLLENTSNSGFLRLSHHEGADIAALLASPPLSPLPSRGEGQTISPLPSGGEGPGVRGRVSDLGPALALRATVPPPHDVMRRGDLTTPFENCPLTDFSHPDRQQAFAAAVRRLAESLPLSVPGVVNGRPRRGGKTHERECPSEPSLKVATVALATPQDADEAVRVAYAAWPAWRDRPVTERAMLLERLADRLEADRLGLAALEAYEVAKPWRESDADVAEAVDFCRYYARQALVEMAPRPLRDLPGESNQMWYEGRGPALIIAPWNFPLAILCGMATAALVAGNTVLLKPASQSSAIGFALYERMIAAGFHPQVVQFVPGEGREIGAVMVDHPLVAQIAFTGSKQVGLSIIERAAKVRPGQPQVKRVVCEMGGKNAVIVDDDADLDEAILGVMKSAFGYAGQKCSACSRVIVVGSAYEPFMARLIEACRSIHIAPAHDPACVLNAVIDRAACEKLRETIANPDPGATPVYVGEAPRDGYYVAPAVFLVTDSGHRSMHEEFFGPILTVMRADTFERALELANNCEFKLTGAVFSRMPSHLELARQRFRVGNLYLNRGCTGALVGRQPFGGFGMSGIGTKAGGPGYLLNFADPRAVCENTMRRGMTPELET